MLPYVHCVLFLYCNFVCGGVCLCAYMYTYVLHCIFIFCSQLLNFMKLVAIVDGDENMQRVSKDQVCLVCMCVCMCVSLRMYICMCVSLCVCHCVSLYMCICLSITSCQFMYTFRQIWRMNVIH